MSVSEKILSAALKGPKVKKIKIDQPNSSDSHEFNIKPISYRINKNELTIFGQLSHCLRFSVDDQVWFTFKKNGNKIIPADPKKMVVEKQEGGVIQTIEKLKSIGVVIGAYFGVDAGQYFDLLEDHEGDLSFVDFDGGWEKAASAFLTELAKRVTAPNEANNISGLRLFVDDNLRGKHLDIQVGKNIVQAKDIGWNDKASSLLAFVPEGKKLELFQDDNFHGQMLELGPGRHIIRDLKIHKLDDAITSIKWQDQTVSGTQTNKEPVERTTVKRDGREVHVADHRTQ